VFPVAAAKRLNNLDKCLANVIDSQSLTAFGRQLKTFLLQFPYENFAELLFTAARFCDSNSVTLTLKFSVNYLLTISKLSSVVQAMT
jgi:hypothetical protein